MAMIEVSRAELAQLLGLPPDADDKTLLRAMDQMAALDDAPVSVTEQRARAEDRRMAVAAVNAGRIATERIDFWCEAMRKDRNGNRAVLASLAPGLKFPAAGRRTPDATAAGSTAQHAATEVTVTTYAEMDAEIYADPEMHRAFGRWVTAASKGRPSKSPNSTTPTSPLSR